MKISRVCGIIFWLTYIFLMNISFLSLAYAEDWGEAEEGLRARIVPLQSQYVIGQPMRFRLEMTNVSDSEVSYKYTSEALIKDYLLNMVLRDNLPVRAPVEWFNLITIKDPDGKAAPFINNRGIQTMGDSTTIKPGEVVVLHPEFDISELYYIDKPGRYMIQFKGSDFDKFPQSNVLEVEIEAGNLADLDVLTGCLLKILPEGWVISSRTQRGDTGSSGLCLYYNKTGEKGKELFIKILQFKEFLSVPQDYQYLGETSWKAFVYIALPYDINAVWSNAREEISKALKIVQKEGI